MSSGFETEKDDGQDGVKCDKLRFAQPEAAKPPEHQDIELDQAQEEQRPDTDDL